MRAAEKSLKTAAEREKAEKANKNIEDRILDEIDREDIDRLFRTPEIKIIEDNNIKDPSTGKKALGAFILNENSEGEIRLSSKADAQTYIHEKIHALARTLSEKDLERWDNLETGIDLKTAQGQEDFVDLMLEHLRSKEKTGVQFFDDIIEMIKEFIENLRRALKDANVLTPEVKEYLDSLLSNPEIEADDFLTAPEWNNYFKGEGGLFAGEGDADNGSVDKVEHEGEFVLTRSGRKDFGEIHLNVGKYMRRQAGKIRLRIGKADEHGGFGESHIQRPKRLAQLQQNGYDNARDFVEDAAASYDSIYEGKGKGLILVKNGIKDATLYVELELSNGDDFYDVKTGMITRKDFFKNKTPLWENPQSGVQTSAKERAQSNQANNSPAHSSGSADTSLSTQSAEKSRGDNLGDLDTTLYELEQDDLETEAKKAIEDGLSKEDFIQKMLSLDAVEFGLDDGTFDTSLKIAGITEAEKIAELERAWQTASETVAKIDKELLPAETDEGVENDLELIPPNDWKDEGNTDSDPDEMYAGNTDWNIDEYEAQLASAYDKAAAPPPPVDGAITTTQADERFLDLMENEGERDKFIDLMQFTQQESEEYTDFETQIKNRELADKVKRTYGALHIGAEHGVTNLTNSQRKGIHTFIKNHPTQMRLLYTELADNAEFSGYAENEIHDKPHIIDVIRNRDDLSFKEQKTLALLMESADIQKKVDNGEIKTVIEAANEQEKELNNELKNITETAETLKKGYYSQPQF
ncbi:MAG: hypothetical protein Ta2B_09220 [Termitinemataceae bacterium]|nr:MAG: hypothetical protein Ta2B_09220 [Termitinemataceae bacterium]